MTTEDLTISSPDFPPGGRLDDRFAHDRGNEVPTFTIDGVPDGTVELALVCHDPDAPRPDGFVHWILYGLPPDVGQIDASADQRFRPGTNDFGESGFGGPEPPAGHGVHHYYFWVYALDTTVSGTPSRREFIDRYADNVIEQDRVVGTFENPPAGG